MMATAAEVQLTDTSDGVALAFTASEADVPDLRARVHQLAQMYEAMHQGRGSMMWHPMRRGMGRGMGPGPMAGAEPMPSVTSKVTDIDRGARLELVPTDPAQLTQLREHARLHAQRMQAGECWMLQDTPGSSTTPSP